MGTGKLCAYNQTRECFLGLEVSAADIPHPDLMDVLTALVLKAGEGLWILPLKGIPRMGLGVPVDLIYLDDDCKVIDTTESLIISRTAPSLRAASALALPTHAIYSSQTQPGDQLVICKGEEMQRRIEGFGTANGLAGAMQNAALIGDASPDGDHAGLVGLPPENGSRAGRPDSRQSHDKDLFEPGKTGFQAPKNWLLRWLSPDARKAPREPASGLAAYYWTGTTPVARGIRDISSTGLYLVTDESWYLDTLVMMTLQNTHCGEDHPERSISVFSRAVRWGSDGVGLQFVLPGTNGPNALEDGMLGGADRKAIDRFLKSLRKDKG
jgi:hypothetical protein